MATYFLMRTRKRINIWLGSSIVQDKPQLLDSFVAGFWFIPPALDEMLYNRRIGEALAEPCGLSDKVKKARWTVPPECELRVAKKKYDMIFYIKWSPEEKVPPLRGWPMHPEEWERWRNKCQNNGGSKA